jgi:hypothetical protein
MVKRAHGVPVDPEEAGGVASEVLPMIQECQSELRKSMAAMSRGFIMERLAMIERALSRLLISVPVA